MRRNVRRTLFSGLAGAGLLLGVACASGPSGAGTEPAPPATPTQTETRPAIQPKHPRVSFTRTCVDCHESRTPESVASWRESAHGETNVGCFICHGDAEQEFMVRPEPELCMSCHAGELTDYEVVDGHHFRFTGQ